MLPTTFGLLKLGTQEGNLASTHVHVLNWKLVTLNTMLSVIPGIAMLSCRNVGGSSQVAIVTSRLTLGGLGMRHKKVQKSAEKAFLTLAFCKCFAVCRVSVMKMLKSD